MIIIIIIILSVNENKIEKHHKRLTKVHMMYTTIAKKCLKKEEKTENYSLKPLLTNQWNQLWTSIFHL